MARMTSDAAAVPAAEATPVVEVLEAVETVLEEKPLMRGWLHTGMFPAVVIAGLVLMAFTDSTRARVACGVYILTACLLFGVSAVYHRGTWGPRGEAILRRLDHANIFLIIAGTYTPLTVLLLPPSTGRTLLWAVWIAAAAGIAFRVFWVGAPRWLYTPCYIAMGWAAVFFLPDFMRTGGIAVLVLVIVGGLLYSVGGVIYGMKRPNPPPLLRLPRGLPLADPRGLRGPLRRHLARRVPALIQGGPAPVAAPVGVPRAQAESEPELCRAAPKSRSASSPKTALSFSSAMPSAYPWNASPATAWTAGVAYCGSTRSMGKGSPGGQGPGQFLGQGILGCGGVGHMSSPTACRISRASRPPGAPRSPSRRPLSPSAGRPSAAVRAAGAAVG